MQENADKATALGFAITNPRNAEFCVLDGAPIADFRVAFDGTHQTYSTIFHCFYELLLKFMLKEDLLDTIRAQVGCQKVVKTFDEISRKFSEFTLATSRNWQDREGRILLEKLLLSRICSDDALWTKLEATKGKLLIDTTILKHSFWSCHLGTVTKFLRYVEDGKLTLRQVRTIFESGSEPNIGRNRLGLVLVDLRDLLLEIGGPAAYNDKIPTPTEARLARNGPRTMGAVGGSSGLPAVENVDMEAEDASADVNGLGTAASGGHDDLLKFEIIDEHSPYVCLSGSQYFKITLDNLEFASPLHYAAKNIMMRSRIKKELWKFINVPQANTETFLKLYSTLIKKLSKSQLDTVKKNHETHGKDLMMRALTAKFSQYEDQRTLLCETEGKFIVDLTFLDSYWCLKMKADRFYEWVGDKEKHPDTDALIKQMEKGTDLDGNGRNIMGLLLMELRDKFVKAGYGKPKPPAVTATSKDSTNSASTSQVNPSPTDGSGQAPSTGSSSTLQSPTNSRPSESFWGEPTEPTTAEPDAFEDGEVLEDDGHHHQKDRRGIDPRAIDVKKSPVRPLDDGTDSPFVVKSESNLNNRTTSAAGESSQLNNSVDDIADIISALRKDMSNNQQKQLQQKQPLTPLSRSPTAHHRSPNTPLVGDINKKLDAALSADLCLRESDHSFAARGLPASRRHRSRSRSPRERRNDRGRSSRSKSRSRRRSTSRHRNIAAHSSASSSSAGGRHRPSSRSPPPPHSQRNDRSPFSPSRRRDDRSPFSPSRRRDDRSSSSRHSSSYGHHGGGKQRDSHHYPHDQHRR